MNKIVDFLLSSMNDKIVRSGLSRAADYVFVVCAGSK